jgi:hypothetical protein
MKRTVFAASLAALASLVAPSVSAADSGATPHVRINLDEVTNAPSAKPRNSSKDSSAEKSSGADAKKAGKKKADEPPPKIDGMEVARSGDRGYLGVKIENGNFKVSFYDKEKKPVEADVARIALRWPVHYQPNPERAVLLPTDDGKAMTGEKVVRPPYAFKLYITLLKDTAPGDDPAAETYVIDFRQ